MGGGVIGVTAAWYLSQAGAEVEVIERQPGAALETSFANAGEISPAFAKLVSRAAPGWRSITSTSAPACERYHAAVTPITPPPMTATRKMHSARERRAF